MTETYNIPKQITATLAALTEAGYEAYIVGGCVRDLLLLASLGRTTNAAHANIKMNPKDWDITTNAKPEEIMKIFPDSKYENEFGTVLVKIKNEIKNNEDEIKVVEITTYRSEQGYADRRRPDQVKFEDKLDKDLERRDFTINA